MHQAELRRQTFEWDLSATPDKTFTYIVQASLGDELSYSNEERSLQTNYP